MSNTQLPRAQQSSWLGYGFLVYFLLCLSLSIGLMHWQDTKPPRFSDSPVPQAPAMQARETPDFRAIANVQHKKAQFFEFIAEGARQQNLYLAQLRQWLVNQQQRQQAGLSVDETTIAALATRYRASQGNKTETLNQLLLHVDEIPLSLVLAQAANESAWGTSRFALEANNFFGQWCFSTGCGVVPKQRPQGASYEVRRFASADQSIAAYFDNINSHPGYSSLRQIRKQLREQQKALDGVQLAQGLTHYSSRGAAYVEELQAMIRYNRLEKYDSATVAAPESLN